MKEIKRASLAKLIQVAVCLILGMSAATAGQQGQKQITEFSGSYGDLKSVQIQLINDWFERYEKVSGKSLDPEVAFDGLSLSTRTTFEAVTHALLNSELTDESGNSLGTALALVEHVDAVHGEIDGAAGDHQFRIYCRLKPGSREILERSLQFERGDDNTHYHKGYPVNYRLHGGVPSIQISMALDETSVDIDVDYRSSKFPAALVNGHLSSANSDVRAGDNFDRHSSRWTGFSNWWVNWFSLPFVKPDMVEEQDKGRTIPKSPPRGEGRIEEAAYDFFNSWLVDGRPEIAMSYVSLRAFECQRTDPEEPFDLGMAPFQMLTGMRRVNEALGRSAKLEDLVTGIRVARPELRVVKQPHHAAFVLYDVAEAKALEFDCATRWKPATEVKEGSKTKYGKYFATVLNLNAPGNRGGTLALLWGKEGKNWKIVSYRAEPDAEEKEAPDLRAALDVGVIARESGKPEQIAAAKEFVQAWYLDKDLDRALSYVADECFECINLFLREGQQPFQNMDELKSRLRLGLKRTADAFGDFTSLSAVMKGIEPVSPEVRIVTHPDQADFAVFSLPDYMAASYDCGYRLKGGKPLPRPDNPKYGNYYVQAYSSKTFTGESAVLFLLWGQRSGEWKILAFHLVQP